MARREKLLLGSSLLHSFGDSLWFWTFLFATCCYRMHAKITKHMLEQLTKMVPKWSQNLSKIEPGGALDATWEPPLKQGASKTSFLMILAPFWDPLWDQFGVILATIFLTFFWDGFFEGLGLHLGSQNTSKMRPKRWSKHKHENRRFCCDLLYFDDIQGCWKLSFFDAFLELCFGMVFGAHFGDFGLLLGSLLETIFRHFLGTIFALIFRHPKNIEKRRRSSRRPASNGHCLPPPRTPPPS